MRCFGLCAPVLFLLIGLSPAASAKKPVVQYINIAPLPGAGMALDSEGKPDGQGAMQINVPVAYTPGAGFANLSAYAGKYDNSSDNPDNTNGSGVFGMGFGRWPRFYGSGMAVSHLITDDSKAISAQLQVVKETENTPALALGAQDIDDKEGADFSAVANTGVSYFGVATKKLQLGNRTAYATLGYGAGRFLDRPFGGVSVPLSDTFSFAAEYDGYQFNTGVGWRPGGRYSSYTLLVGYNGKAGPVVGAQATGKISGLWAIPAILLLQRH